MTAAEIAAILEGLAQALPELIDLFTKAVSGTSVSGTDVQAIITKFGVDQAVFSAAIAAAKAKGL
jgi:hypothetical protein